MKHQFLALLGALFLAACSNMDHDMNHMSSTSTVNPMIIEGAFNQALTIPNVQSIQSANLEAQVLGGSSEGLGYSNTGILGPILVGRSGQKVQINLTNHLSEGTNMHWHGLEVPVEQDGLPEDVILPGSNKSYDFVLKNRAGLYWYHPHLMGSTAKQAYQGLAGLILIRDSEEDALQLPTGEYEIPLVIQDRRNANSAYNPSMNEVMSGFMGDRVEVNGVLAPVQRVKKGTYRLRLLNGSNARVYDFVWSDGREMTLIGSDGGLLAQPQNVSHLLMGPGERADILVHFENDTTANSIYLMSQMFSGGTQGGQSFKIIKFNVIDSIGSRFTPPTSLSQIDKIPSSTQSRSFELAMSTSMNMNTHSMGMHTINGKIYEANRIEASVRSGSVESWEFNNTTDEIHPIHLHGLQFQVLERHNGRTLLPQEMGWKDTFVLLPGERATIGLRFGTELGRHLFHCHNLEHEEDGMMLQYEVTP